MSLLSSLPLISARTMTQQDGLSERFRPVNQGGNREGEQGLNLRRGRIHEVTGAGADMFAVIAAAQAGREVIWIGLKRDMEGLCPTGLARFIDPSTLLLVEAVSRPEVLWAADTALPAERAFSVIVDMPGGLGLKESRRL